MREFTEITSDDRCASVRLDKYLSEHFPYKSRSMWQKTIEAAHVEINGRICASSSKTVRPGDVLRYVGPEIKEPEVDGNYSLIFEDDFIIGINKPANLPVHPAGIFFKNTLLSMLEEKRGMRLFSLHRLDRETSGIILFGKNKDVSAEIQGNFDDVRKTYLAITRGVPRETKFVCDKPLGRARKSIIEKKREAYYGAGESALTCFETLRHSSSFALLRCLPATGRQHQIRVHLSCEGFPIIGDKLYGLDERLYLDFTKNGPCGDFTLKTEFPRCALHSRSIIFFHPVMKRRILLCAPIPPDMKDFIERNM